MLATTVAATAFRPRRSLRTIAERASTTASKTAAVATVVTTGVVSSGLQLLSGAVEPAGRAAAPAGAVAVSLVLPALLVAFWIGAALLVDFIAGVMGASRAWAQYRRLSAFSYPVLVGCALITLAQSALDRTAGSDDPALALGMLNLGLLLWFIAINGMAVRLVYRLPPLNAAAAALFPYAVLSVAVMALMTTASIAQVMGA